jgi:hypothetical protein
MPHRPNEKQAELDRRPEKDASRLKSSSSLHVCNSPSAWRNQTTFGSSAAPAKTDQIWLDGLRDSANRFDLIRSVVLIKLNRRGPRDRELRFAARVALRHQLRDNAVEEPGAVRISGVSRSLMRLRLIARTPFM